MKELSILEQAILTTILRIKDNAYGVTIRKKVEEVTGKKMIYGTLYNTLDQLLRKEYVIKTRSEPTTERGGRSRMYYHLTKDGIKALESSLSLQKSIWDGITNLATEKR